MDTSNDHSILRGLHALAFAAYAGSATAVLALRLATERLDYSVDLGSSFTANADVTSSPATYDYSNWFGYQPVWLIFAMATLAALIHLAIAIPCWQTYSKWAIGRSVHAFAWIEYATCGAIAVWLLMALTGCREVGQLVLGAGALAAAALLGYAVELVLYGYFVARNGRHDWREGPVPLGCWIASAAGFLFGGLPVLGIATRLITSAALAASPPAFMWWATAQTLVLFTLIGVLFSAESLFFSGHRRNPAYTAFYATAHLAVSVTATLGLTWIVVGGLLINE